MSYFLLILDDCPKCGKNGVGWEDREDWVGKSCVYCDWEEKDEVETIEHIKMLTDFKKWHKTHPNRKRYCKSLHGENVIK